LKAPGHERFYEAADRFVQVTLRSDESLFSPGKAVWSRHALDELHARFVESPDISRHVFEVKLERQLAGATATAIQLMAETIYVHLLIAVTIGGRRKRELIRLVLSWSPERVGIPSELDAALDEGLVGVGTAFNTYRPFQLHLIVDAIRAWKGTPRHEQEALLLDPWAFKEFLFSIPIRAAYSQREALLHIVFPDTFEDIVSRDYKRRIVEAFRALMPGPEPDVDRALLAIRQSLQEQHGQPVNFHSQEFGERWRPQSVSPSSTRRPVERDLPAAGNEVSPALADAVERRFATQFAPVVIALRGGTTQRFDLVGANGIVGSNPDRERADSPADGWKAISEAVWLLQNVEESGPRFLVFTRDRRLPRNWLDHYGGLCEEMDFLFFDGRQLVDLRGEV
jgi:hypothetical protein